MLKKVILGIICFIVVTITGIGIYVYTLDWNQHKSLVAERFSQITGLKATIDGNLEVKLFPSPKFTAGLVKFSKNNSRTPLVEVKEISSSVELLPMFSNKFILSTMSLSQASVFLDINEKGEFNWSGVGSGGKNKSGNIEVSFNDVRLSGSTINYTNKKNGDKFEIPNISANISANSLEGPYRTSGKFIHNNSEFGFNGDVVNGKNVTLRMNISNVATGSKLAIDGAVGDGCKGSINFDSKSLYDVVSVVIGENKIAEVYDQSIVVSFLYEYAKKQTKFDNFTIKYGNSTAGSGTIGIKKDEKWTIDTDLEMISFDLGLLETIAKDIIKKNKALEKSETKEPSQNTDNFALNLNIKSNFAKYQNADAQKLILGLKYANNVINLDRFNVIMPGETSIKSVGKVNLGSTLEFIFNNTLDSKDLRIFASVFGLDIAKYTTNTNKKSAFKKAQAEMMLSGNLNSIKLSIPQAVVDSSSFSGNMGFILGGEKPAVLIQADIAKIVFDKYFDTNNSDMKNASLEERIVYRLNQVPWKGDFETEASFKINNAVYNNVAIEKLDVRFIANNEQLNIEKLHSTSVAGAEIDIKANMDKVYSTPYFNELSYSVKTGNFPLFADALGINRGNKGLFKRKIFAAQGALSGSFSNLNLSSIQKFGDVEFSYTGTVKNTGKNQNTIKGDIEFKTDNFSKFVKAIGIDYNPDIPVTTFTLTGGIDGTYNKFSISNMNAYLGTNHIIGDFTFDNESKKPYILADASLDKFDINRMFNMKKDVKEKGFNDSIDFVSRPNLDEEKIDLSILSKVDFDITAKIKALSLNNETYANTEISSSLKNGVLDVSKFSTTLEDSKIAFNTTINTNGIAKIEGKFDVIGFKTPNIGGKVYRFDNGFIDADGSFNSIISSKKEFFDNLNSKGRFKAYGIAVTGWDLDIIKFELEQRKRVAGFNEAVMNSLKSGKSSFDEIRGKYEITKGVVVSDGVVWDSPVITMNMALQLNLANWQFDTKFNAFYKNASFSDALKFELAGDLEQPQLKTDLEESLIRIADIEKNVEKLRESQEKEKTIMIDKKSKALLKELDFAQKNIKRMSVDVAIYKPITKNRDVIKVYDNNIKELKSAEAKLKEIETAIKNAKDEKTLMDLEAKLAKETASFTYIPKILEENYVVDSKYVFDDAFNKITWLFNLAQNNSSYYNSLTEEYLAQIDLLKSTENPVDEKVVENIKTEMNTITGNIERISKLHSKIRDNYLDIIDTTSITKMKENNKLAEQALSTMFTYVKQLNNNLISSIDSFRIALGINAKDYDHYMVYPPHSIADIDISLPTAKNGEKSSSKKKTSSIAVNNVAENDVKKKDRLEFSFNNLSKGISLLMDKLNSRKASSAMSQVEFKGLSTALNNIKAQGTDKEENVVVADNTSFDVKKDGQALPENTDINNTKEEMNTENTSKEIVVAKLEETIKEPQNEDAIKIEKEVEDTETQVITEENKDVVVAKNDDLPTTDAKNENLAENNIKEQIIVADAENKIDNNLALNNFVEKTVEEPYIEQTEEKKAQEPAIVLKEDKNISIASNIIDKTKTVLSNLISKISNKNEENKEVIKTTDIEQSESKDSKEEITVASLNTSLKDEILPDYDEKKIIEETNEEIAKTETRQLKVNPVIAMNIGNTLEVNANMPSIVNNKKGFEKKDEVKESKAEEVIIANMQGDLSKNEEVIANKAQEISNADISKDDFLGMFNFANISEKTKQPEVLEIVEVESDDVVNKNKYVHNVKSRRYFNGDVDKTIHKNDEIDNVKIRDKKYLFEPKYKKLASLDGKIGKKFALSVK